MKFLLFLFIPIQAFGSPQIEDAKRSIMTLIRPLISGQSKERPKGTEKFRVDGCDKVKINWKNVLLMKDKATISYKFKEGCDIQGDIEPKVLSPFEANLDLRNIESYSRIETKNKITADLQTKPILNLEMRDGFLSGKAHKVKFEVDYGVQLNPMKKKAIEKNLGGELRISEVDGKPVSIKEKIMVK